MNMPVEDSSEGLFNLPLLAYVKIVKIFIIIVFPFPKKH